MYAAMMTSTATWSPKSLVVFNKCGVAICLHQQLQHQRRDGSARDRWYKAYATKTRNPVMDVSITFRVVYTVRDTWNSVHKQRLFDTRQAAEEFIAPLVLAARKMGEFHDMPAIDEVGVITSKDGVRFSLGPRVDVSTSSAT